MRVLGNRKGCLGDQLGTIILPHQATREVLWQPLKLDAKAKKTKTGQYALGKKSWADAPIWTWDRSGHLGLPTNGKVEIKLMSIHYHFWSNPPKPRILHQPHINIVLPTGRLPPPTKPSKYPNPERQEGRDPEKPLAASMKIIILLAADYLKSTPHHGPYFQADESHCSKPSETGREIFTQLPLPRFFKCHSKT